MKCGILHRVRDDTALKINPSTIDCYMLQLQMYRFAKYFLLVEREQDVARYVVLNLIGVDEERQSLPRVLW